MPLGRSSPEADAVEAAFIQRVQILYQTLATNLGDSPGSERKAVEAFKKGLTIARRGRELALQVVETTSGVAVVEAMTVSRSTVKPRKSKRAREKFSRSSR
jgi:hypothetical protein